MADENSPAFNEQQSSELNRIINGVAANLKKQFEGHISKALEGSKGDIAKLLDEKLQSLRPPPEEEGKGGKGKGKDSGPDPQIVAMQRKLDELTEANRTSAEKAAKADTRRRALERTSQLDAKLAKGGVSDPFMRELAISHFNQRGLAPWSSDDEESEVVWSVEDGLPVPLDDGLGKWFKTEEGKRFLPPSGTRGSGSRPGQRPPEQPKREASIEDVGNWVLGLNQSPRFGE